MKPVLRYPGSKWNIADWIVEHIPEHIHYCEPYFGSGAVFFKKQPSKIETISDLDGRVVNLFKVLREQPEELARLAYLTPWSREEYEASYEVSDDPLEDARRFLVRCWQAYGTRTHSHSGWKNEGCGTQGKIVVNVWNDLPEKLLSVVDRLKYTQIENRPAAEVIERLNQSHVFIYADPPYVIDTRSGVIYSHEMTEEDHLALMDALDKHPGPVILSGYENPLYQDRLPHWKTRRARAQADGGREREECIWINPIATKQLEGRLFY